MTPAGMKKMMTNFASFAHDNDGTASWLDKEGPGPFDGPESLALAERCLLGFSGGPPMLPSLYNNYLRIVQADDYVMIMAEMVHDARVVKIDAEHDPSVPDEWLGDSVGYWDGDTLVVKTQNFRDQTGIPGGSSSLTSRSGSRVPPRATCTTTSGSRIRWRGRRPGPASTSGPVVTARCTSTPATKATTPWATSFEEPVCSSRSTTSRRAPATTDRSQMR